MKGLIHIAVLDDTDLTACVLENRQDFKEMLIVKILSFSIFM